MAGATLCVLRRLLARVGARCWGGGASRQPAVLGRRAGVGVLRGSSLPGNLINSTEPFTSRSGSRLRPAHTRRRSRSCPRRVDRASRALRLVSRSAWRVRHGAPMSLITNRTSRRPRPGGGGQVPCHAACRVVRCRAVSCGVVQRGPAGWQGIRLSRQECQPELMSATETWPDQGRKRGRSDPPPPGRRGGISRHRGVAECQTGSFNCRQRMWKWIR